MKMPTLIKHLAYVTEQTHEIRFMPMVCVIAGCLLSSTIMHKIVNEQKNSAHRQCPYIHFVPHDIFISKCTSFLIS